MTEKKLTMEDRLAERLKQSDLGTLMDDEDLKDLCVRAVERAFFKGRPASSYGSRDLPPIVVEMAEEAFRDSMKRYVDAATAEIVKKPEFQEMAAQYMITSLPQVLRETVSGMAYSAAQQVSTDLEQRLRNELGSTLSTMPFGPSSANY